jgi:hypothetical protein
MALTLFRDITQELTDLERDTLVPMLINILRTTNETNRFTGRRIIQWFSSQGYPITQIRLCKMIAYIRLKNLLAPKALIGAGNGYFSTSDTDIIEDQIESLQGRIDAMNCVIDCLNAQKLNIQKL